MVIDDLKNDHVYQNLLAETHNECSKFGHIKMLIIPRCGPGAGSIFIEYETAEEGGKIVASLGGIVRRKGGGIEAEYCDPACLCMNNYFNPKSRSRNTLIHYLLCTFDSTTSLPLFLWPFNKEGILFSIHLGSSPICQLIIPSNHITSITIQWRFSIWIR